MTGIRHIICAILMIILCTATGCQSKTGQDDSGSGQSPPHITVAVYDRGTIRTPEYGTLTDNRWTEMIKKKVWEELGIEIEFASIPREADASELAELTRNKIDIFFTYETDDFLNLVKSGAAADLSGYMNGAGASLQEQLGEEILKYGRVNGGQYAVNGIRSLTAMFCSYIRKDWLECLGIELPVRNGVSSLTPDELMEVMIRMKDAGFCQYPYGLVESYTGIQPIEGAFIKPESIVKEQDRAMLVGNYLIGMDGDENAFLFLNECYRRGLIRPDYYSITDNGLGESIAAGECGFWSAAQWMYLNKGGYLTELYDVDSEAEIWPVEICQADGSPALYQKYSPIAAYVMVSSDCGDIPAALAYLEWCLGDEAHIMLQHGIEGEHWEYNEDDVMVPIDSYYNYKSRIDVTDLDMFLLDDPCLTGENAAAANRYTVEIWKEPRIAKQYLLSQKMAVGEGKWSPPYLDRIIESAIIYKDKIDYNTQKLIRDCIMAPEGFAAQVYSERLKTLMEEGGRQVLYEKLRAFRHSPAVQ